MDGFESLHGYMTRSKSKSWERRKSQNIMKWYIVQGEKRRRELMLEIPNIGSSTFVVEKGLPWLLIKGKVDFPYWKKNGWI